jgi:hypothetical protein
MADVIPWGEWRPDVSPYKGEHSPSIINAYPRGDGYGPVPSFASLTEALEGACRGFYSYFHTDGTIRIFAATSTRLFLLDNSDYSWADVSASLTDDYSGNTLFGNLAGGGNLAAAFDGDVTEAAAACASVTSTVGYVGATMGTAIRVKSATVYGSNDNGFVNGANPSVTLDIYGKEGTTPATSTDGTIIGTVTFTDTADESAGRAVTITDQATEWDHVWVRVNPNGNVQMHVAELVIVSIPAYSTIGNDEQWQFTQFGTRVIAVNPNADPQSFVVGSSSEFADLTGATSIDSAYVTVVSEFVVLSGISGDPFTIQWSSRSDAAEWTAGTNEGDTQTFRDGGLVRGIAGGEYGLVFQDACIRRMTYQPGSDVVFSFDRVSEDFGLFAPYSIVRAKDFVFFLSHVGFQQYSPTTGFKPIGKERVDRTFFEDCDKNQKQLIIGTHDPAGSRVMWAYKSAAGESGYFDRIVVYDYVLDRWAGFVNVSGEYIATAATPGATLESLDSISASLDALDTPLDDIPTGFARYVAMFNDSSILGLLSGANMEATLETPEIVGHKRVYVNGQRPITDCTTVMGSVATRQRSADVASYGTESLVNSVGFCPHRADTRLMQFKNRFPAGATWSYSIGVEPDAVETGMQ